ncbi:LysM peptidoglycan-binding domain-containing protein [Reyranella sp.]|uniref:LysM peptidoglycan-binding domain-containing protein n=1 Tax=Reyranella sp. TaxID=1929291 RepID=UPI003BAA4A3B
MSRSVIWLVVAGAIVIALGLGVAWQRQRSEQAALDRVITPAAAPEAAPAAAAAAPAASATPAPAAPPAAAAASKPSGASAVGILPGASSSVPAAADSKRPAPDNTAKPQRPTVPPTFDVARIGPDGRAVIAGRATAGAKIVLLNGGKEIAQGQADSRGEWVLIAQDPPLPPGQHELRVVEHIEGRAPVTSDQVVVAVVPEPPARPAVSAGASAGAERPREETLVMISPPAGGSTLVQAPSKAGVPKSGDLVMSTLDYDERGQITVSGRSSPGTVVRAYVDDKLAAEGAAGSDGHWRLKPPDAVPPGKHTLRLDRLASDGKPVARLELPFDRVTVPPGAKNGRRLVVVRGDNLWNIAHAHYGAGYHHTVIFGANQDQIRDPDLIYPGQVFSLPDKVN